MSELTFTGVVTRVARTDSVYEGLDSAAPEKRHRLEISILLDGRADLIPVSMECDPLELPGVAVGQRVTLTFGDPSHRGALQALRDREPEREAMRSELP